MSLHVIFTLCGFVTLCKQIVTMLLDVILCHNYTLCTNVWAGRWAVDGGGGGGMADRGGGWVLGWVLNRVA